MNKRVIKRFFLPVLFSMGLSLNANAVKVHINSGNPAYPFPQFLEYACGGNLGTKLPEGLSHAEMEQQIREAYQLHANEFEYTGEEWAGIKYIATPYKAAYDCTEGDGYALLAAAYMADKTTFDGYWMCTHDKRRNRSKKYSDCKPIGEYYGYGPFSLSDDGKPGGNSAADGDEDVALALYVAYKQWGEFMLDKNGEKVLDACGEPISYKKELIEVVRGLVALSTRFAYEKELMRVNSGMIGLDGYVKNGDTWGELTKWASENPTVFSDSMTIYTMSAGGPVNVEGISLIPEFGGPNQHYIDYKAPAYYREFHDLLLSLSNELGMTNEWEAEQFRRAEASSDWLIGQLIAKNKYSVPTAGKCTVNDDGTVTTFENDNEVEDFRTPWRTISNYVWHGNPKYSWNPVSHKAEENANTYEYDAAVKFSKFMNDPMSWNDSLENSCYTKLEIPFNGPKTMAWMIDPMTGASTSSSGDQSTISLGMPKAAASFAAIGAQDYNLMGELYGIVSSVFDEMEKNEEGERVTRYMQGWFRQLGMMALTGNYAAPSQMEASSNLKIYRSIKDSVSSCRVGDTITYILSYRNYGSKDATDVMIVDTLPNDFQLVSVSDGGVYRPVTNEITWPLGDVPGFKSDSTEGAALDFSAPNLSKTMGEVYYKCVVKPGASGKYSLNATIYSKDGRESKTNEYPNYVTATMQRNTIDIIPNTLSVSKSADRDTVKKDDVVEFTIAYSNTDSLPFLTGGRSRVNFTVAGTQSESWRYKFMLRINNDAIEPVINTGNYRVSFFMNTKNADLQLKSFLANGFEKTITDECFSMEKLSDSIVAMRTHFPYGLSSNTIWLNLLGGVYMHRELKGTVPLHLILTADSPRFLDVDFSGSWSDLEPAEIEDLYYPVSPSYQIPDSIVDVDKVIYSACDNSDVVTETVLVEEYDGHTWRKILGDAPYNGIEAENVVITDSIPLGFEFVSFVGDSTGATYEATPDADFSSGIVRYRADKLKIGEKGSFGYKCRYTGPVSGGSYVTSAIMESKNEKVKSTMHLIVDDLSSVKQTVNEDGDAPVDVYNAQGQLLKRQVSPDQALEGLSKGVYMVGNKKKVVTK